MSKKSKENKKKTIINNILELREKIDGNITFDIYRQYYSYPKSHNAIKKLFGITWKQLLDDLGINNQNRYSDQYLIDKIIEFYNTHGRKPNASDFATNPNYPHPITYQERFGYWNNAIKKAGFEPIEMNQPKNREHPSEKDIIKDMQKFRKKNKRYPKHSDYIRSQIPNMHDINIHFVTFRNAFYQAFGFSPY